MTKIIATGSRCAIFRARVTAEDRKRFDAEDANWRALKRKTREVGLLPAAGLPSNRISDNNGDEYIPVAPIVARRPEAVAATVEAVCLGLL